MFGLVYTSVYHREMLFHEDNANNYLRYVEYMEKVGKYIYILNQKKVNLVGMVIFTHYGKLNAYLL